MKVIFDGLQAVLVKQTIFEKNKTLETLNDH